MNEIILVHPVISGESKGPTAWGLSFQQTLIFGASLAVAFVGFSLLKKAEVPPIPAAVIAGALPLGVFLFLAALVMNKPVSYAKSWCGWRLLQLRQSPLFERQTVEFNQYED